MYKAFSTALIVGGVVLAVFGFRASQSLGSDISRFFTGNPTDKAIWMLVGGIVLVTIGIVGLIRTQKARS